jgi:hypothetical protein
VGQFVRENPAAAVFMLLIVAAVVAGLLFGAKGLWRGLNEGGDLVGPGRFLVRGVMSETGADATLTIDAESGANAGAKAELRGMVVTKVQRV